MRSGSSRQKALTLAKISCITCASKPHCLLIAGVGGTADIMGKCRTNDRHVVFSSAIQPYPPESVIHPGRCVYTL